MSDFSDEWESFHVAYTCHEAVRWIRISHIVSFGTTALVTGGEGTAIQLSSGEVMVVLESVTEVKEKVVGPTISASHAEEVDESAPADAWHGDAGGRHAAGADQSSDRTAGAAT